MLPTETETDRNQRGDIMCALVITAHGKETQTDRQISDYLKNLVYIIICKTHLFLLVS